MQMLLGPVLQRVLRLRDGPHAVDISGKTLAGKVPFLQAMIDAEQLLPCPEAYALDAVTAIVMLPSLDDPELSLMVRENSPFPILYPSQSQRLLLTKRCGDCTHVMSTCF